MAEPIAWIAWWPFDGDEPILADAVTPELGSYTGYIGLIDDSGREVGVADQMPELWRIDEVLAWARKRSRHIRIRPSWDPSTTYFHGDSELNPGLPLLQLETGL